MQTPVNMIKPYEAEPHLHTKIRFGLIGVKEVNDTCQSKVDIENPAPVQVVGLGTWRLEMFNCPRLQGWVPRKLGSWRGGLHFGIDGTRRWDFGRHV
jgi:hypothetical protein